MSIAEGRRSVSTESEGFLYPSLYRLENRGWIEAEWGVSEAGSAIGPSNYFYGWVDPEGLTGVTLQAGNKVIRQQTYPGLWETTILYRFTGVELLSEAGAGEHTLRLTASYRDGSERSVTQRVKATE